MAIDSFGERRFYIFKYMVDHNGDPTEFQGDVVDFVDATDSFDAMDKAGFTDYNTHGANLVDKVEDFESAIADERKLLKKLSKKLKDWSDADEAERQKFLKERPCPNNCGQLDEKFRCPKCGYGREGEEVVKELDKVIEQEKEAGNDTSELEKIRDSIQADLDS
ncbi:MAG: hypothetical protein GY861_25120 [bacterium]|nr:hypothetical protein [bacterium]